MAGLISYGQENEQTAQALLGQSAGLETTRNAENQMKKKAQQNAEMTGAASGAGTGAMIGSVVPGVGTAIGAGVGALAGWLMSNPSVFK